MKKTLTQISIHNQIIKNRLVMAPLATWLSDESGEVKNAHIDHYHKRKGPGLIIVEATTVSPEGRLSPTQLGIFDDRHIKGLANLARTISDDGGLPGIQIHYAGGKATPEITYGKMPLVPSKSGVKDGKVCRELTIQDINRIKEDFVLGARRAVEAGFKYIEIHGAHGYLGTQFLSPITNKRTDEYGGSLENRQRFILETYKAIKEEVQDQAIVSCRLGAAESNGLTIEEGIDTAKKLEELGMQIINISCAHTIPDLEDKIDNDHSVLINIGAAIKRETNLSVIGIGGVKESTEVETILEKDMLDLIAVGKAILADPQWAQKIVEGNDDQIERCIDCKPCRWFKEPEKCPIRIKLNK